jgi:uncharacterized membrane protein YeaQ/YmgE (transglycosylase-associated protein family)
MGIIAWIVLGLAAGLFASMLIPGKRSCRVPTAAARGGSAAA